MRLYVEQNNTTAMHTYRDLGIIPSGHVVYEHDWSNGRWRQIVRTARAWMAETPFANDMTAFQIDSRPSPETNDAGYDSGGPDFRRAASAS